MHLVLQLMKKRVERDVGCCPISVSAEIDPLKRHPVHLQLCFEGHVPLPRAHHRLHADQMISVDPDRRLARGVWNPDEMHEPHSIASSHTRAGATHAQVHL